MDHSGFVPHGVCLLWTLPLVILIVTGELLVALAYLYIPYHLLKARRSGRVTLSKHGKAVLLDFGLFIFFCGTGHMLNAILLWYPWYWFAAWWTIGTAIFSWRCAFRISRKMDLYVATLQEPANLTKLQSEVAQCRRRISELEHELEQGPE